MMEMNKFYIGTEVVWDITDVYTETPSLYFFNIDHVSYFYEVSKQSNCGNTVFRVCFNHAAPIDLVCKALEDLVYLKLNPTPK
jgi:hypothetical protein